MSDEHEGLPGFPVAWAFDEVERHIFKHGFVRARRGSPAATTIFCYFREMKKRKSHQGCYFRRLRNEIERRWQEDGIMKRRGHGKR